MSLEVLERMVEGRESFDNFNEVSSSLGINAVLRPVKPVLRICICPSYRKSGRAIRAFLDRVHRQAQHPEQVYVLTLPENADDYLKGRKRQALRTNLRKCDQMGLSAERVTPERARAEATRAIDGLNDILHLSCFLAEGHAAGYEDWIGYDTGSVAIGFARLKIDGDIALLTFLTAIKDHELSIVRYRLSADIYASLASRGIKYVILFYDGPQENVNGYFAERLGFMQTDVAVARDVRLAWSRTFLTAPRRRRKA